ncbi:hypothetical protein BJY00DRAFT_290669 [Aspergillus carlsbadensis]|nr:hypothetical protein BJY00DRAFT_290669 [Aspergillus carlsbadensis]
MRGVGSRRCRVARVGFCYLCRGAGGVFLRCLRRFGSCINLAPRSRSCPAAEWNHNTAGVLRYQAPWAIFVELGCESRCQMSSPGLFMVRR